MGMPYIGEIKIISWNYPPKGWLFCDGQLLPINQNQALFSLLGTFYGGDGRSTFALPNLRGRIPVHVGNGFTQGQVGGEENHTVIVSELPQHIHLGKGTSAAANTGSPLPTNTNDQTTFARFATNDLAMYSDGSPDATLSAFTANAGGSQAHNNLPPFLVLNFIIAMQGVYPPRT